MMLIFSNLKTDKIQTNDYIKEVLKGFELTYEGSGKETTTAEDDISNHVLDPDSCVKYEQALGKKEVEVLLSQIECAKNFIDTNYPTLERESLVSLSYTYLIDDYNGIPASTPVFRRETDIGVIWIVFDYAKWNGNALDFKAEEKEVEETTMPSYENFTFGGAAIIKALGIAVLKGFAGKIGSSIFDKLFNTSHDFYDELYKEITRIIKQELTQAEIDKLDGEISGVTNAIYATYNPYKKQKPAHSKKELNEMLNHYFPHLEIAQGILGQSRFKRAGFSIYMINSYLMITLAQEFATIDTTTDIPQNSSYAETVRDYSQLFKEAATATMNDIINNRRGYFSYKKYEEGHVSGHDVVTTYYFRWKDSYTGTESEKFKSRTSDKYDPKKDCKNKMNEAANQVVEDMKTYFKYYSFIRNMEALHENPIPRV